MSNIAYRPSSISSLICDPVIKGKLSMIIKDAKLNHTNPGHTLLTGGPGLGKTTIAKIIAKEMNVPMIMFVGDNLKKTEQLDVLFEMDSRGVVMFVDEIHNTNIKVLEMLYILMEDGLMYHSSQPSKAFLSPGPICLIGATTEQHKLPKPLLGRFKLTIELQPYTHDDIVSILKLNADRMGMGANGEQIAVIAEVSGYTPRQALNMLSQTKMLSDNTYIKNNPESLYYVLLGLNNLSLVSGKDKLYNVISNDTHKVMSCLYPNTSSVGLERISAATGLDEDEIRYHIEPQLITLGILEQDRKGRRLAKWCYEEPYKTYNTKTFPELIRREMDNVLIR